MGTQNGLIEIATGDLTKAGFTSFAGQFDTLTYAQRTDVPVPARVKGEKGLSQMHRWDGAQWVLVGQPTLIEQLVPVRVQSPDGSIYIIGAEDGGDIKRTEKVIAFVVDVEKAEFRARSNEQKIEHVGPFVEDLLLDGDSVDGSLSSDWVFDTDLKCLVPGSPPQTAIVITEAVAFAGNVTGKVTGIWEAMGTVRIYFSRNDGVNWTELSNGSKVIIVGPNGKTVRFKAEIEVDSGLKAWSAHW